MSITATDEGVRAIYDWQAKSIEQTAAMLAHWVSTTNPEKLDWCPELKGRGRSVYDQINECAGVNRSFAAVLRGETPAKRAEEHSYTSAAHAGDDLIASGKELAEAVRNLGPEALTAKYTLRMGEVPGAVLVSVPLANMNYHAGQVNFIQLLDGDEDFHLPPGFFG